MRSFRFLLAVLSILWCTAQGCHPVSTALACTSDDDCVGGDVCALGVCAAALPPGNSGEGEGEGGLGEGEGEGSIGEGEGEGEGEGGTEGEGEGEGGSEGEGEGEGGGFFDSDDDGVDDLVDNCIIVANPDQHDEDGDTAGDVCDSCPHVETFFGFDSDSDDDGVGDSCDPQDGLANTLVLFEAFAAAPTGWAATSGEWEVDDDELHSRNTNEGAFLFVPGTGHELPTNVRVEARVIVTPPTEGANVQAGILTRASLGAAVAQADGYFCNVEARVDNDDRLGEVRIDNDTPSGTNNRVNLSDDLAAGTLFTLRADAIGNQQSCRLGAQSVNLNASNYPTGGIGVRSTGLPLRVLSIAVYSMVAGN